MRDTRDRDIASLWAVIFILLVIIMFAMEAKAQDYPRVASYAGNRGWGGPLIRTDGTFDSLMCRRFARFPLATLHITPSWPQRPDLPAMLRHYNPSIKLLGYTLLSHWYLPQSYTPHPSDQTFAAQWHRALVATNGFMTNAPLGSGYEVNLGNPATAYMLGDLLAHAAASGLFDGIFLDYCSPRIAWTGFTTAAEDSQRVSNVRGMVALIRALAPPGFRIYGNTSKAIAREVGLDNILLEGFPAPFTNHAMAAQLSDFDMLKAESVYPDNRTARYALATACFTGAYGVAFPYDGLNFTTPWMHQWWFDEYAVTPVNGALGGRADTTGTHTGWLGKRVATPITYANGLRRLDFPNGMVLLNPGNTAQAVDLLAPRWRRIRGVSDPIVNNGRQERVQFVPAHDAVFLVHVPKPKQERP